MFDPTSRYSKTPISTIEIAGPDGEKRTVRFVRRRFIPPAQSMTTLAEHHVVQGDRLDNVTARYLGDPTQFWRVADANEAMRPEELTDEPGSVIKIALPQG